MANNCQYGEPALVIVISCNNHFFNMGSLLVNLHQVVESYIKNPKDKGKIAGKIGS